MRPQDPVTLDFDVESDHIPAGFLKADIKRKNRRHLIFMTKKQQHLLKKARSWYVDGTFKVVGAPFTQLFSIHGFIEKDGQMKQVGAIFS